MLNQIRKISKVGIFKDYGLERHIHSDVEFGKLNIIYGKNGSGKSTIVEILKSLSKNDKGILLARKTLSSSSKSEIELIMDNELFNFNNGWNKSYPNIHIFDQDFINKNIYLADSISTDNRRNQFKLIIGKENIEITKQLNEINVELRENNKSIKKHETYLLDQIQGNLSIEDYINLKSNDNIEEIGLKLEELYKMQESYNQIYELNNLKPLSELETPDFNLYKFINFVNNDINQISLKVEEEVKAYCHRKELNIEWINTGVNRIIDNTCPFCNQGLEHSDIFSLYKTYFNQNMLEYNNILNDYHDSIIKNFRNEKLLEIMLVMEGNYNLINELSRHLQINYIFPKPEDIKEKASNVFRNINSIFTKKMKNQFKDLSVREQLYSLRDEYDAYIKELESYNRKVYGINQMLEDHKAKIAEFDLCHNENQINYYLNLIRLSNPALKSEISSYLALKKRIELLKNKKMNLKAQSIKIDKVKLSEFYKELNETLRNLDLTFKVSNALPKYNAYGIEVDFSLVIDNIKIKSRATKNKESEVPNFKNTLSEGEKSLLGLAYFITSITLNSDTKDSIIVFDDPTNYCDNKKKTIIANQISKLITKDNQILVFTHDFDFTKKMVELGSNENIVGLFIDYFDSSAQLVTSEKVKSSRM